MTTGTVYLVGAGPGDPGLLTVRAAELIARADVILHDRLVPAEALAGARPDAELLYVGKQGGGEQVPQAETDRLLVEHARAGRTVVRLKGGDPFVFGRGGEEALICLEAGIPFEVVPGVTAGVAAPAYAGIPVTHRELASGVAFVTGHEDPSKPENGARLAGARRVPRDAGVLHGRPRAAADRGAARRGWALAGRACCGHRARHAAGAADGARRRSRRSLRDAVEGIRALRDHAGWRRRGLGRAARVARAAAAARRSVAVTRARAQASALAARLRELGAAVVEAPAIRSVAIEALAAGSAGLLRPAVRDVAERGSELFEARVRGLMLVRWQGSRSPPSGRERLGH